MEAGDRTAGAQTAQASLELAQRLGARWLAEELTALAQRARLGLGEPEGEAAGPTGDRPSPTASVE